jgi:histone H3/H4
MIVKSLIQEKAKAAGMNVGSEFYPMLDKAVEELVAKAIHRAKENGRKTLHAKDV